MGLGLKRFWFLVNQIDRIEAAGRLNHIEMLASVTSEKTYAAAREDYKSKVGKIFVWTPATPKELVVDPETGLDPEFDRAALRALKAKIA